MRGWPSGRPRSSGSVRPGPPSGCRPCRGSAEDSGEGLRRRRSFNGRGAIVGDRRKRRSRYHHRAAPPAAPGLAGKGVPDQGVEARPQQLAGGQIQVRLREVREWLHQGRDRGQVRRPGEIPYPGAQLSRGVRDRGDPLRREEPPIAVGQADHAARPEVQFASSSSGSAALDTRSTECLPPPSALLTSMRMGGPAQSLPPPSSTWIR